MARTTKIDRRTVLRSAGAVISLPFLEAMASAETSKHIESAAAHDLHVFALWGEHRHMESRKRRAKTMRCRLP